MSIGSQRSRPRQQAATAKSSAGSAEAAAFEPVVVQAQAVVAVKQAVSADPVESGAQGRTQPDASAVEQAQPVEDTPGSFREDTAGAGTRRECEEVTAQSDMPAADAGPAREARP